MTRGAEPVPSWQSLRPDEPDVDSREGGPLPAHTGQSAPPVNLGVMGQPPPVPAAPASPATGYRPPPNYGPPPDPGNVLAGRAGWQSSRGGKHAAAPGRPPATVPPAPAPAEETAVLPKFPEAPPETPPSLAQLAARHGLGPAGSRPGLGAYTGQVWRYRQFIATYANGRLIASFGAARLGRFWQVLTPLINAAVYYLVFGIVLDTQRGIPNFIAYLCIGVFVFTFTQAVVQSGVQSISGQLGLVRALQFPRAALPIAALLTQLQSLLISVLVLLGIVYATEGTATTDWLLLAPALILQSVFSLGLALFVARIGAQIPDAKQLMPYVMRTWMYASGVFYSAHAFAAHLPPLAARVVQDNPMLVYIELARHGLLQKTPLSSPPTHLWTLAGAWALVSLIAGYVYFWRGEPEYGRG